MTSVELLERAAKVLRDSVEAVVLHGPWEYRDGRNEEDSAWWQVYAPKSKLCAAAAFAPGTAEFMATLHPPVALALANWLEAEAATIGIPEPSVAVQWAAAAVARAILREGDGG